MAAAKDRLTAKPKNSGGGAAVQLQMPPAQVRVRIPEIKIPPAQNLVTVETKEMSAAVNMLSKAIEAVANQQNAMLATVQQQMEIMRQQGETLARLAGRDASVHVAAPNVKMPPRPHRYYVEFDRDGDEITGMVIETELSN